MDRLEQMAEAALKCDSFHLRSLAQAWVRSGEPAINSIAPPHFLEFGSRTALFLKKNNA